MPYKDDLSNEKAPSRKRLLPEGWRVFKFRSGKEQSSKAGNSMFVMSIEDVETENVEDIYVVRTPGKRWLLKTILEALGIERKDDGYTYELEDLLHKNIMGEVIHEPNEYINRKGETIRGTQHKIVAFKRYDANVKPEDIKWEE